MSTETKIGLFALVAIVAVGAYVAADSRANHAESKLHCYTDFDNNQAGHRACLRAANSDWPRD